MIRARLLAPPPSSPPFGGWRYTLGMDAPQPTPRYTVEVIEPAALATASLRREWDLLDPRVCGVREVEQPSVVAVRVTVLDEAGAPCSTIDAAYYPEIEEFGVTSTSAFPDASADESPDATDAEPTWLSARTLEEGIERTLRRLASTSR